MKIININGVERGVNICPRSKLFTPIKNILFNFGITKKPYEYKLLVIYGGKVYTVIGSTRKLAEMKIRATAIVVLRAHLGWIVK